MPLPTLCDVASEQTATLSCGCSNSGRDGIIAGNPGFELSRAGNWYEQMNRAIGSRALEFARLFKVPNMVHWGGGPVTDSFAATMLQAINEWIESGRAPNQLVAANINPFSPLPNGGLLDKRVAKNFPTGGTRQLYPYPQQSRYQGSGSTADADHFARLTPDPSTRADNAI